ncbi:RND transporter, HAE1 family [Candidatus Omnitrophus magneticus]|uniref:RND transporter, HAE1 family n=1 Tax=Candidatus Omnitrophus magneticus TaxID=1609969 RepID=A0A0F0CT58_9BACT|nr:RND transporter, HAE1 family [Candidatus Omnitrophus magneticus]
MSISRISIKNPVFAWMIMYALMFFGLISFSRMGISQLPNIDFPVISINLTWEGASPGVMESDVVDIVEDSIMTIQSVKQVASSIKQGTATITVEFELERNIDVAFQDVQTKLNQAQRSLPKDLDPPIITKTNPDDQPILWLAVYSDKRPLRDLMAYVEDHLKDRFSTINGVGEIFLSGFVDKNLRIWADSQKLKSYELTVEDIINTVNLEHQEVPAGRIETPKNEFNVRVMGEAPSAKDFSDILIPKRNGKPIYKPIYLKDVASIEDGLNDIRRITRSMGKTAVGMGIRKQRGSNEVAVARKVLTRLTEVQKNMPEDISINVRFNRTRFSEDSMHELIFTLILSALVTSLVCWIFLGSWSATINILLAIPTSVLGTFIIIYFLGFTLNTMTVLALSLSIGIVVDDAILVLENIVRMREKGLNKVDAALKGATQITFAALVATIALIAIFLPIAFMSGMMGKFFFQFGVTLSIAVALSLLEALTLAPMRCSRFLQAGGEQKGWHKKIIEGSFKGLSTGYRLTLAKTLKYPWIVLILANIFFFWSLSFIPNIRKEFVPAQDQSMFLCRLQTPSGSSLEFTDSQIKQAETFLTTRLEVSGYLAAIGGFGGGDVNMAMLFVTLKPPKERPIDEKFKRPLKQSEIMPIFRKELNRIPNLKATIQDMSLSGFSAKRGFPIEFYVTGPDWKKLSAYSNKIQNEMEKTGLMIDVDTDYLANIPEIQIIPDRDKAEQYGINISTIGTTINALIGGTRIGKFTREGRRYDIRVRLVPSQRSKSEDIMDLEVWNNHGELVKLKDVVSIKEEPTALTITRNNRERAITIFANIAQGKSQATAIKSVESIAKKILPEGYNVVFSGSSQTFKESFNSLIFALLMGIIIAYMVLAAQFNSYIHPISVLYALPFSISGALIILWLTGQSLNIYSFIGLILLMGIVKKNSILLVDFTNKMRHNKLSPKEALIEACPIRLRPILMTSISTIAAALPAALAMGPGAETRIPMAITIVGGVTLSTIMTLFVVPSVYLLLTRLEGKKCEIIFEDEKTVVTEEI